MDRFILIPIIIYGLTIGWIYCSLAAFCCAEHLRELWLHLAAKAREDQSWLTQATAPVQEVTSRLDRLVRLN